MGETTVHHRRRPHQKSAGTTSSASRLAMRGEIVEVQGGHIVRSTGRKDRHSKVCTAKGPRDRRVRLSAHTAIQFYDVQDRLGYDRPSKAVDWLIKNAKSAIDELAHLPPWNPNKMNQQLQSPVNHQEHIRRPPEDAVEKMPPNRRRTAAPAASGVIGCGRRTVSEELGEDTGGAGGGGSGFLPPTLDADIADTLKSFIPMGALAAEAANSSSIQFESFPPDLLSRTSRNGRNNSQDLRLSLQSFRDPIFLHQHHHHHSQFQTQQHLNEQLFSATNPPGFDGASSYSEEHGRLHRMVAWDTGAADPGHSGHGSGVGGGGFVLDSPSPMPTPSPLPPLFGQGQYLSQRGPLQSSYFPSIRAWIDPSLAATTDHHHHHYLPPTIHHQSAISGGIGFASGGFSGFRIPARIQGEEEHDGVSDKPSSASSDSCH